MPHAVEVAERVHLCVDNGVTSARAGRVYCAWSDYAGSVRVWLRYSLNHGDSWRPTWPADAISIDSCAIYRWDQRGVNIQTAPSGRVYATWAHRYQPTAEGRGILFRYSTTVQGGTEWNSPTFGQQIKELHGFGIYGLQGKLMGAVGSCGSSSRGPWRPVRTRGPGTGGMLAGTARVPESTSCGCKREGKRWRRRSWSRSRPAAPCRH